MRQSQICDNLSVSFADSIPTPFVPSGHFPLIGGIGPWEGSLFQRQIIWKRASLVASASGWNWTPSI